MESDWDVFISYASEDCDSVARPICDTLSGLGVRVWFDQTELLVGGSLRQKIDEGLSRCRYGVVVLSSSFFSRNWPRKELNGLAQRETEGEKVILPVWHGMSAAEVRRETPMLADRIAANTSEGILEVCVRLLRVVRPDIMTRLEREFSLRLFLPRITEGRQMLAVVSGAHAFLPFNDVPQNAGEAETIAAFLECMRDWGDIVDDIDVGAHVRAQFSIGEALEQLKSHGFAAYAGRQSRRMRIAQELTDWSVAVVAVLRGTNRLAYVSGNRLFADIRAADGSQDERDTEEELSGDRTQ
jgi:hypothetical protein